MSKQKSILSVCAGAILAAAASYAQAPATPPATATVAAPSTTTAKVPEGGEPKFVRAETPAERKARLATAEEPGMDPDQKKHFWRFGKSFHIEKYDRRWADYDQPEGFVRPWAHAMAVFEVYQQNDRYVWVWVPDELAAPPAALPEVAADPYNDATYDFLKRVRPQYTVLTPPASSKKIKFRASSSGLPTGGSWRNSGAVADMNEDGCLDFVTPPERKGNGLPSLFLGDCKGNWRAWTEAVFPIRLDYGSVVVADFNKDKHMDMAFAVHLIGVYAFLGDGKGHFTNVSTGLPNTFPTRRLGVADVDRDGYPDIIATAEGPTEIGLTYGGSMLRAFVNRKNGTEWQEVNVASPETRVGGDWLSVGNLNGDAFPDVISASAFYGATDVVYLGTAAKQWKPVSSDGDLLPSLSYYYSSTMGRFTSKKQDDAIVSYVRFWPPNVNPQRVAPPMLSDVSNLDRITFENGKLKRHSIARWQGTGVVGVGSGDFDSDGNLDVIYVRDSPRTAVILLGDGRGEFRSAVIDGLPLATNPLYDIKVADVNGDSRSDVIVMYESGGKSIVDRTGSIQVFLNSGVEGSTAVAKQ